MPLVGLTTTLRRYVGVGIGVTAGGGVGVTCAPVAGGAGWTTGGGAAIENERLACALVREARTTNT